MSRPQFGASEQGATGVGQLKPLPQLPIKCDQKVRDSCEMKDKYKALGSAEETASSSGCSLRSSQSTLMGLHPWERALPCDASLFQLHYMDLEEFLTDQGMSVPHAATSASVPSQGSQCPPSSPSPCSSSSPSSSCSSSPSLLPLEVQQARQGLPGVSQCLPRADAPSLNPSPPPSSSSCPPHSVSDSASAAEVVVNFDPDPVDLALSSVPGQDVFNPRTHRFSEDELKPQPMVKKARKTLVPDNQKDDKYWKRRIKNNEAAKRSRDARRLKENQISVRAAFLERENATLRQEVASIRRELGRCRSVLSKYESRHGEA